jgi:hypothetical protein
MALIIVCTFTFASRRRVVRGEGSKRSMSWWRFEKWKTGHGTQPFHDAKLLCLGYQPYLLPPMIWKSSLKSQSSLEITGHHAYSPSTIADVEFDPIASPRSSSSESVSKLQPMMQLTAISPVSSLAKEPIPSPMLSCVSFLA